MQATTTILAALLTAAVLPAQAAGIRYGFDNDAQGWTVGGGAVFAYVASGGNPGGYLRFDDADLDDFVADSPAFAGANWSQYLGGSIAFDAINLSAASPDYAPFGEITLTGSGLTVTYDGVALGEPPADGLWHRYSVPLTTLLWGPNLAAVLASVDGLTVKTEYHVNLGDGIGFDNVTISAVPEPPSWLALLAGGTALLAARRRRDQAA